MFNAAKRSSYEVLESSASLATSTSTTSWTEVFDDRRHSNEYPSSHPYSQRKALPPLPNPPQISSASKSPRPTNLVFLAHTNQEIVGSWVIDPTHVVPEANLHPRSRGSAWKNLWMQTRNGEIDVDVTIAPTAGAWPLGDRTTMQFNSQNGSITLKIHKPEEEKVSITTTSYNGSTTIYIPRCFQGFVTTSVSNGSLQASPALVLNTSVLVESSGVRRAFVGEPRQDGPARLADELYIETRNGSIKLRYTDESPQPEAKPVASPADSRISQASSGQRSDASGASSAGSGSPGAPSAPNAPVSRIVQGLFAAR